MEETATGPQSGAHFCPSCWTPIDADDDFCNKCGCPLKGTEQEQRNFISNRAAKEIDLDEAHGKVHRAGNALFWIGGATFVFSLIGYVASADEDTKNTLLIINTILSAINVGLGFWARKKPLPAIIAGLSLFVLVFIVNAFADPAYIVKGMLFKIIILVFFITGIRSAIEAEKIKKELHM
ncbi:MAG TPA: zinc ribbon domain-containing protein [Mucilaginibacter sp.]|jgi:hypothetical protein|nr:zinc ribbon domain-containing protein [Mucilaginibacter sp.]